MSESIQQATEYRVIEPIYEGNAVEGLEKELNELGEKGWRVSGVVAVREANAGEKTLSKPVQVVILERDKS